MTTFSSAGRRRTGIAFGHSQVPNASNFELAIMCDSVTSLAYPVSQSVTRRSGGECPKLRILHDTIEGHADRLPAS